MSVSVAAAAAHKLSVFSSSRQWLPHPRLRSCCYLSLVAVDDADKDKNSGASQKQGSDGDMHSIRDFQKTKQKNFN